MEKKYVRIQSDVTITVTPGLQCTDYTKKDSDVPNRFSISPNWQEATVLVKQGAHYYPAKIAEWKSVKALVEAGKMTIGEFTDEPKEGVEEASKELESGLRKMESEMNKGKKQVQKKLADI